jgi:hypothetical protein
VLGPLLERLVHRPERGQGVAVEGPGQEGHEQAPELLGLGRTVSLLPSAGVPSARTMNGFHSGYAPKSVSTSHTRSGRASMSIELSSCLATATSLANAVGTRPG